jgi:NitT/TauT family transport system substrate-binding protein
VTDYPPTDPNAFSHMQILRRGDFAGSIAAFACGALVFPPRPARAQSGSHIRMPAVATETFAQTLYAQECGAFTRAGLNVDLQLFASGAPANQAMSGGALDVSANDPMQLANAIIHGVPFRYFAAGLLHVGDAPTTELCVAKNGPVKTAKDLEGQAIAVPTVLNLASLSVREWMAQNGADSSKARFVEFPNPAMPAAIARGAVAAGMVGEPYITLSANETRVLANSYNTIADRFILNAFYARREWLADNPDLARRLAAALYDAARWANTHHADTLAILVKYGKVDPDKLSGVRRATYATAFDPALLRPVLDIALKYKAIDRPMTAAEMIARV